MIVVGVALFAFLAGDAWRVLQPHQTNEIGEVNGETLSAQDFQAMIEEYKEYNSGRDTQSEQASNEANDMVWNRYLQNQLVKHEAEELGLVVSAEEIKDIIEEGTHPYLAYTPFKNPQTNAFDKDLLKKFLADYATMKRANVNSQEAEYYTKMYGFWKYVENMIIEGRLAEKYQALISQSIISTGLEAETSFAGRVNQADFMMAAVPYSSIDDADITISDSELKSLYNKKKELFKVFPQVETRDIKYIDVHVTASTEDRNAIEKEVAEYTAQLATTDEDMASFIRSTGSKVSYADLYLNKDVFPQDVVSRMDTVAMGKVFGPYYNMSDNTFNSFRVLSKATMPDAVEFRQIMVYDQDINRVRTLADSITTALKGGADFAEVAKIYGQDGAKNWLKAEQYEAQERFSADDMKFIKAVTTASVNEVKNLEMGQARVILQVTDKKDMKDKFKVAVIKRDVNFSKETYNQAYNNFSQFIAANPTKEALVANAEENGYRILDRQGMSAAEHMVGGLNGTKEALRWVFAAKKGEVSGLFECGENDHMLVVAVEGINEDGYRSFESVRESLRAELLRDKKAEKIMADMKNVESFAQYATLPHAVSDTVKHVTFSAPAYIPALRSSELVVSSYVPVAKMNETSAPMKGNAGVIVLKKIAEEKSNDTYNQEAEIARLESMYKYFVANTVSKDLYKKADVKDSRYLFF